MSKAETEPPKNKRKSGKGKVLLLILLPLLAGGGAFYAAFAGLLPFGGSGGSEAHGDAPSTDAHGTAPEGAAAADHAAPEGDHAASASGGGTADVAFVEVPPIVISLGSSARARQLHFAAHLEVTRGSEAAVAGLMPRILDVLNGYLRAVETADLEERATLIRLRAQMLRRVRLVAGPEVKNLLVGEFILN